MTKAQTILAALSLIALALVAGLVISVRSQLKLMRQVQGGTQAIVRQVHRELYESPIEEILSKRSSLPMRRAPGPDHRDVLSIELQDGTSRHPETNGWTVIFHDVGVSVQLYLSPNQEREVSFYPYEAIKKINLETN
jgi:predicted aspartyl protease